MRSPVYISLLFVLYVSSANGQWTMKFEPNISFPVSLVEGTHLSGGFGFDVTVGYTIATDLVIHAGWGKNVFAGDNNIMHPKKGFEESRLVFGGQIYKSLKNTRFKYMIGAGFVTAHIDERIVDENKDVAGRSTGWFAESGISYQLLPKFSVMPQLAYTYQSVKMNNDNWILLKYISPGVSFTYILRE